VGTVDLAGRDDIDPIADPGVGVMPDMTDPQHLDDEAETEVDSGSGSETGMDSDIEPARVSPKKGGGRKRVVTLHPPTQIIDGPRVRKKPRWMNSGEYVVKHHNAIATVSISPQLDMLMSIQTTTKSGSLRHLIYQDIKSLLGSSPV